MTDEEKENLMSWPEPVPLVGAHARLEPLSHAHLAGLTEAVKDGELWKLWYTSIPRPEDMAKEIDRRLVLQAKGSMLPFTVFDSGGEIAGMSTYMNIDAANRRVEIGSTWYARRVQRTALNTQCKLLLLTHAFEKLDCIAVEFRTHFFNQQSRRGIERLGAKQDGILRNHQIAPNGTLRDTVVFSIIASEWPTAKAHLTFQLNDKPR
jgi:RimJ/RimL family protein N-acetyltransferase